MKTFSNIFITVSLGVFATVLFAPDVADSVTERVLATFESNQIVEPIQGLQERVKPFIPSVLSTAINKQTVTDESTITPEAIVEATNAERIKAGVPPLQINSKLVASATIKTNDMITRQYFEHDSPSGKGVSDLGREVGYQYVVMGENLALGNFASSQDVVKAWMESPGHRANMLNPNYQEIGVSVANALYQGREVWFAVQHFGTGRTACPTISTTLKASIDALNADLKARQAYITTEKALLESPNRPSGEEYATRVGAFNNLVSEYNTTLVISQEKIKEYNAQVNAFNSCLGRYQSKQ